MPSAGFQTALIGGAGSTPSSVNVFAGVSLGLTIYYAGLGVDSGGQISRLSDSSSFQL